jgi:GNAT superfamily N-acetyltransferase
MDNGKIILTYVEDKPVGCIAYKTICDSYCEIKRLYVQTSYRGNRIGRMLINCIVYMDLK